MRFFVCSIIAASAIFASNSQNDEYNFVIVNSGASVFANENFNSGEKLFRDSLDKNQQKKPHYQRYDKTKSKYHSK